MRKTINLFSRVLCALVLCAGLVVTGCAKINDALEEHGNRLDNLEGVQIKSLNDQISSINISLKSLESMDGVLQELIGDLEAEAGDLQAQLDDNAAADAATKKALEDEIASIKALIAALQAKDAELDKKISDLETYVDSKLKDTKDWANSTFATLAQYEAVQTEITAIKVRIERHKIGIAEIEARLTDIESRLSGVEQKIEEILSMIQSITHMPEYYDGSVSVYSFTKEAVFNFKLSPSSVVSSLETIWENSLSVKYLTTKLTKATPVMQDLPIKSAEFDTTIGTITLLLNCSSLDESFYQGTTTASAALFISDGKNNVSSDFIPLNLTSPVDLSSSGAANSYIVSESGAYKLRTVKGNGSTSVGSVSSAEVLWESFGTSTAPSVGDLVKNVTYEDGCITFEASDKKGNAVIAAKDADGKILWSWHIWLTDQPAEHVYNNNAGTMMDRNLGATSATPGDVGALGLLYQWGRKDPFLGSSSIDDEVYAKSTITWPSPVESTSSTGTIDYVTANPTTFVTYNSNNYDWYYTGSSSTDNTRWQSEKTIYDPCPAGWRVPDGGEDGVWSKAGFTSTTYDSTNEGMNFSGKFGTASTIWYPASGSRFYDGGLKNVGGGGLFWSVTPYSYYAYSLYFSDLGDVYPSYNYYRARGFAVRCLQE